MAVDINLTPKQSQCWEILLDNLHSEVLYGGSAGSGKSWLGCLWITSLCLKYAGIRCLIGRTVLSQLKITTLNTLFETFRNMGMISGEHFNYNGHSNIITFTNGSEIILKDLQFQPSDPNYDSLGSLEITAAFVDEAAQITYLCYSVLRSRIRYKLNEYNLQPKIFMTCNPAQSFLKKEFYIPYVQDTLEIRRAFIPALPTDNPHLPASYIDTLRTLPEAQRRRLLEGDWNYMEESDALFKYDEITNSLFKFSPNPENRKYMSVDVARFGTDRSVVCIWVGLTLIEMKIYQGLDTVELSNEILELAQIHKVSSNSIITDSDGVGGGVADQVRGVNFVANSRPLHGINFTNLKSQCYVKLSELFKEGKISINLTDPELVDTLTQELLAVKLKDVDKDNKVAVISKDEMKRMLGASPDLADAIMFRMWFELKNLKASGRYAIMFTGMN